MRAMSGSTAAGREARDRPPVILSQPRSAVVATLAAVPVAGVVVVMAAAELVVRRDPAGLGVGRVVPAAGPPDVVPDSHVPVPVAADPDVVRTRRRHDHLFLGRGRRTFHLELGSVPWPGRADIAADGGESYREAQDGHRDLECVPRMHVGILLGQRTNGVESAGLARMAMPVPRCCSHGPRDAKRMPLPAPWPGSRARRDATRWV